MSKSMSLFQIPPNVCSLNKSDIYGGYFEVGIRWRGCVAYMTLDPEVKENVTISFSVCSVIQTFMGDFDLSTTR